MKVLRIYLLAATVMVAGATTVRAQNGDEILQKHIDAVGGIDKWSKINSMKMTGSMNVQGMDINMTQIVVNEKGMRMDISVMGMNGYTIITPKEGWVYMPFQPGMDKVTPIPADELKASQDKINIKNVQLVDRSKIAKAEYLSKDTLNSIACYKLKITDKEGNAQTAYFDASNYYLVRSESKIKVQDQEQEMGVTFSDFRKLPEGITVAMAYGTPQGDITFKTIEINKPYEESVFKPDAEVKK